MTLNDSTTSLFTWLLFVDVGELQNSHIRNIDDTDFPRPDFSKYLLIYKSSQQKKTKRRTNSKRLYPPSAQYFQIKFTLEECKTACDRANAFVDSPWSSNSLPDISHNTGTFLSAGAGGGFLPMNKICNTLIWTNQSTLLRPASRTLRISPSWQPCRQIALCRRD